MIESGSSSLHSEESGSRGEGGSNSGAQQRERGRLGCDVEGCECVPATDLVAPERGVAERFDRAKEGDEFWTRDAGMGSVNAQGRRRWPDLAVGGVRPCVLPRQSVSAPGAAGQRKHVLRSLKEDAVAVIPTTGGQNVGDATIQEVRLPSRSQAREDPGGGVPGPSPLRDPSTAIASPSPFG